MPLKRAHPNFVKILTTKVAATQTKSACAGLNSTCVGRLPYSFGERYANGNANANVCVAPGFELAGVYLQKRDAPTKTNCHYFHFAQNRKGVNRLRGIVHKQHCYFEGGVAQSQDDFVVGAYSIRPSSHQLEPQPQRAQALRPYGHFEGFTCCSHAWKF